MLGPETVTEVLVNQAEVVPPETQELYGIIPRATFHMFDLVNQGISQSTQFLIKCSYIEIYNESINDLLVNPPAENLRMREFPNLGMCVIGMTEKFISTPEEVFDCLSLGTANRIVCATGQNARSSRSHTVFILVVEQKLLDGSTKVSKLNLVDLAGSEKLSKTGAEGQALKEAQNINLSLTTLGRCINALTAKKPEHIPFRESKLTMILKESLGGNSKTALICTASQKEVHKEESITTLKFAERAKMIQNKAQSNVAQSPEQMRAMIEKLKKEVEDLKKQLRSGAPARELPPSAPEDAGPFSDNDFKFLYEEMEVKFTNLQVNSERELEDLRRQLEAAELKASQSVDTLAMHEEILYHKEQVDDANKRLATAQEQALVERQRLQESMRQQQLSLEESQRELALLKAESESTLQQLDTVKAEVEEKKKTIGELENRAKNTSEELASVRAKCAGLEDECETTKRTLQSTEKTLEATKLSAAASESELQSLKSDRESLNAKFCALELDYSHLQSQAAELRSANSELKSQVSALTQTVQQLEAQQRGKLTIEEAKALEQRSREELTAQMNAIQERLTTALADLERERAKAYEATKAQKLAELENQRLSGVVEALKAEIGVRDTTVERVQGQVTTLGNAVVEAQRAVRQEQAARETERNHFETSAADLRKQASDLEIKHVQETGRLQASLSSLNAEITSLKIVVSQRDSQIAELTKKLRSLEEDRAKLESKAKKLEYSMKAQAKETADLRKNSVFSQVLSKKGNRGSVISSAVKMNTSIFGGVVLKKTGNKFLQDAIAEAERSRLQAPVSQYKVYYGAADIKALYSSEEVDDEPAEGGSHSLEEVKE